MSGGMFVERFPLLREGKTGGEVILERQGLYARFTARAFLPDQGLWCAWLVGERGELRLGVLEPEGEQGTICRRFSGMETAGLGPILRGELRRAGEAPKAWTAVGNAESLFQWEWLRGQLRGFSGGLTCREEGVRLLAMPWDKRKPFPLVPLFCLGTLRCIGSRYYIVYAFSEDDRPILPKQEKFCKN